MPSTSLYYSFFSPCKVGTKFDRELAGTIQSGEQLMKEVNHSTDSVGASPTLLGSC